MRLMAIRAGSRSVMGGRRRLRLLRLRLANWGSRLIAEFRLSLDQIAEGFELYRAQKRASKTFSD